MLSSHNKKIGIFITARLGSTRLNNKHLLTVSGIPIVSYLIKRIIRQFNKQDKVLVSIVSTSENENKKFESLDIPGLNFFYGCKTNIPYRHLQALNQFNLDAAISVDGDDILCSTKAMQVCYDYLQSNHIAVKTEGLPLGMNVMAYSTSFLEMSLKDKKNEILETGWGKIFNPDKITTINISSRPYPQDLRLTLDYQDDFIFFKKIIKGMGDLILDANDNDIIEFVLNKKLNQINSHLDKEYWNNFEKEQERDSSVSADHV